MSKESFIKEIAKHICKHAPHYHINCNSAVIAQAIVESGWGESKLSKDYHNYFGLKCGTAWTGPSVNLSTQEEYTPGQMTNIRDNFRVYSSLEEGIIGYFEFIQLPRYLNLKGIENPREYLTTIKNDGYATSGSYVDTCMRVVDQFNLIKYDKSNTEQGGIIVSTDLWTKTAELMAEQSGYLEKRSNSQLDSKTGNAGYNNYTKYARDIDNLGLPGCQGQPWCAVYQFWICVQIFGKEKALDIMGDVFYNCTAITNHAKASGTWGVEPKLGALVIFRKGAHIGRVTKVTSTHIYTNEGNTSATSVNQVVANGGCVADKVYTRVYSGIDGYVYIDYKTAVKDFYCYGDKGIGVKAMQEQLRLCGYDIRADGDFGPDTQQAVINFQKANGLTPDGNCGPATQKELVIESDKNSHVQEGFHRFVGEVQKTLGVHERPKKESPLISKYPQLKKHNLVDVLGRYGYEDNWFYVCIADKYYGYAWAPSIKRI